mgnify:FL=1|jgi:uncharacterized glyoxalase superfamily protein PhnB
MRTTEFRLKLYPRDFSLVRSFYHDIVQFPVIEEWDNAPSDQGVMFNTGTAIIELLSNDHQAATVSGCSLSLAVDDVHNLWQKFKEASYIVHPLRNNSWGDTSFAIHDPEGFQITFFTKTQPES